MEWALWEPTYRAILADFGYDRAQDEVARDELDALLAFRPVADLAPLRARFADRDVVVAGPKPQPHPQPQPVVATDAASWAFGRASCIVTDLDGDVALQAEANARGVPLFVHAHGDNRDAVRRVVPKLTGPVAGTTQAEPRGRVANFGGFTDGDRACCVAVALGASSLTLAGFDFDAPWPKAGRDAGTKLRKLAWARRIVDGLGVPVTFA